MSLFKGSWKIALASFLLISFGQLHADECRWAPSSGQGSCNEFMSECASFNGVFGYLYSCDPEFDLYCMGVCYLDTGSGTECIKGLCEPPQID